MASKATGLVTRLERWSPIGFLSAGIGFLISLGLLVIDEVGAVTVPEIALSVVVVPTLIVLSVLGLPGYYPYVKEASPRLALAGGVAAVGAGISVTGVTVGKIILDLLGIIGFTDEGPLLGGFFLWLVAFFLSLLFYGLASAWTGEPSRLVGGLLLIIIVEPAATLLNDLVGVDISIALAYATLGIAGVAFLAIGYVLRTETGPSERREPTPGTAT